MLTRAAQVRLKKYLHFQDGLLKKWLEMGDSLLLSSEQFVEPQANNQEKPFSQVISGFEFLTSAIWNSLTAVSGRIPASASRIREQIYFVAEADAFLVPKARVCLVAVLFLLPSLKKTEHMRRLWNVVRLICLMGLLKKLKAPQYPATVQGFRQFYNYARGVLRSDSLPLPLSMKRYVTRALDIYSAYWESNQSPLQTAELFYAPDIFFTVAPRVIASGPNGGQPRIGMKLRLAVGLSSQSIRDRLSQYKLVLSGGRLVPFNILGNPLELQENNTTSIYLVNIKPKNALDGRTVHCGPVNLLLPAEHSAIKAYLEELSRKLAITSNRFWLPWDAKQINFLWKGKPEVVFQVPYWLEEGQFTQDSALKIYGAEHLDLWVDNAKDIGMSGPVPGNTYNKQVALPLNMQTIVNADGTEGLYPRRYPIRIVARNRCARVDQTWETGVAYPLKLQILAYDAAQTISTGLRSKHPKLRHQPAYKALSLDGQEVNVPLNPPLVRGKGTWIRLSVEHNAPLPYFRGTDPEETQSNALPCMLEYEVQNITTNQIVSSGTLSDDLLGDPKWFAAHEGVLDPQNESQVLDAEKLHQDIATRLSNRTGGLFFHFVPTSVGTHRVTCRANFHPSIHQDYGIGGTPNSVAFDIQVKEPKKVKWHWVQILAEDNWRPVKVVTDTEFDYLEEWLTVLTPSVEFEFQRGESVEYKPPTCHWGKSDRSRVCDKIEDLRGTRIGIFMGVMTPGFKDALDESMEDIGGAARYAERSGFIVFRRYGTSFDGGVATMSSNAGKAAHEFGHAHPKAYHHYAACADPLDCVAPLRYYKPNSRDLYPAATCGEKTYYPGIRNKLPRWDFLMVYSPEGSLVGYDIMTYCCGRFFEIQKAVAMHENYSELSGE
jgi:hypothetical protein